MCDIFKRTEVEGVADYFKVPSQYFHGVSKENLKTSITYITV